MELPIQFLMTYGYLLLFGWVLVEQLGVPLPAAPVLLAAGALSAEGQMNFAVAVLAGLVAATAADVAWFMLGRKFGSHILRRLCRISMEPGVCVRRTQNSFGNRGRATLLIAKFVPGLATLAPPVAGQNGMSFGVFLFYDALGSLLWLGALLATGRAFGDLLKRNPNVLDWVGRFSGALLALGVAGFFVWRLLRERTMVRKLAAARIEPVDLKAQLDRGEEVFIVDLRHPLELLPEPYTLPGARHFSPDTLAMRHHEIPRDREIVLYCTCPSEATAAKTAMTLHKLGIERVRPLRGGYDEWKRLGYPLEAIAPAMPQPAPRAAL